MTIRLDDSRYPIGALAGRTGCSIETIRYYERIGLMPPPPRSTGGHRVYDQDHLKRLTFIRRGRALGFTLDQVRDLLGLVDGGDFSCEEVRRLTLAHLAEIGGKIADLRRLQRTLDEMAAQCDRGELPDCPIIETLFDTAR